MGLDKMLNEDELRDAVVLVFANKQDLPKALKVKNITEALGLDKMRRQWFVQGTCATSGDGLYEGLDWLSSSEQEEVDFFRMNENVSSHEGAPKVIILLKNS